MSTSPNLPASLGLRTKVNFEDNFTDPSLPLWYQDTFEKDTLHRTGYEYLELDGTINPSLDHIKVPGRWAALMNDHRDKVQFVRPLGPEGKPVLVLKPHFEFKDNPYRINWVDRAGVVHRYAEVIPYSPWLSTWTRKWSEQYKRQITDWDHTTHLIQRGSVVETRANFENQVMGACRFSTWLMGATRTMDTPNTIPPAEVIAGQEYNDDVSIVEIDIPEVENPSRHDSSYGQHAVMKILGGKAGDTPNSLIDLRKFGIDLRKGWHTFTLVWHYDGTLEFYVDGIKVGGDKRKVTMVAYLILSCEQNSGLKDLAQDDVQPHENISNGPKAPRDVGLTARSVYEYLDLAPKHEVLVDRVSVYRILEGENDRDIPPVIDKPKDVEQPSMVELDQTPVSKIPRKTQRLSEAQIRAMSLDTQLKAITGLYEKAEQRIKQMVANNRKLVATNKEIQDLLKAQTDRVTKLKDKLIRQQDIEASLRAEIQILNDQLDDESELSMDLSDHVSDDVKNRVQDILKRTRAKV